jgi:hypothetical protein
MRSLRSIKKSIGHARIASEPRINRAVLRHLRTELAATTVGAPVFGTPRLGPAVVKKRGVAAMAAALVILILILAGRPGHQTTPQSREGRTVSAGDLLTVGCLNAAYRRGGLEALDRRCEEAARRLDTRPEAVSLATLIRDLRGI